MISSALQNMREARDRVIATNLAREGLEAVRNIRDTNWLKFSNDRRGCWNHFPGQTVLLDSCDGGDPILPGNYIVYKNNEFRWKLDDTDILGEDTTRLTWVDIDLNVDSDLDGELDNDLDMYNHILTNHDDTLGQQIQNTLFQRTMTVQYLENQPIVGNPTIDDEGEWEALVDDTAVNRMLITSTVTWPEGGGQRTVELKTILTDYLGRSSLSG